MTTTTTATTTDYKDEARRLQGETSALEKRVRTLEVRDDEEYKSAAALLTSAIKPLLKAVDATFGPILKAQNAAVKETRDAKKRHREPLEKMESAVKRAMAAFHAAREQAQRRIAARSRPAQPGAVAPPVSVAEPLKADGVSVRAVWKFEVVDDKAINSAFLTPDLKKIGATVRAMGADATATVGGIRVWEEGSVAAGER